MKLHIPIFKKHLYVESKFRSDRTIVSLGCDCHPAYMLDNLHLRKLSLPFDWLRTESTKGLYFAEANIRENFKYFFHNLDVNCNGNVISSAFPYSEFYHDRNLINDSAEQEKYRRRISRFLTLKETEDISYLYAVSTSKLLAPSVPEYFLESIRAFLKLLKSKDTLHIYFRSENDNIQEINVFNYFVSATKSWHNVTIVRYNLQSERFGFWGNEKYYPNLLSDLNINVKKKILPELYFSSY